MGSVASSLVASTKTIPPGRIDLDFIAYVEQARSSFVESPSLQDLEKAFCHQRIRDYTDIAYRTRELWSGHGKQGGPSEETMMSDIRILLLALREVAPMPAGTDDRTLLRTRDPLLFIEALGETANRMGRAPIAEMYLDACRGCWQSLKGTK
jgi:hypothetical protein